MDIRTAILTLLQSHIGFGVEVLSDLSIFQEDDHFVVQAYEPLDEDGEILNGYFVETRLGKLLERKNPNHDWLYREFPTAIEAVDYFLALRAQSQQGLDFSNKEVPLHEVKHYVPEGN